MTPAGQSAWAALDANWQDLSARSLRQLFASDPSRYDRLSVRHGGLLIDFSKCRIDGDTLGQLVRLAEASDVAGKRDAMFDGRKINATENRAALHIALRNLSDRPIEVDGKDVMGEVRAMRARLGAFAEDIRAGRIGGLGGAAFKDVVNIGIGGSDLGPAMATAALAACHDGPRVHFVSNVDGAHLSDVLDGLEPATTLFIIASKTFSTVETITNAETARAWLGRALGETAVGDHFVAVSTALDKVAAFGIEPGRVFGFWDWVGGRYSLWSAIGLPLMIAIGRERFERMLAGAYDIDEHFRQAPVEKNLPMLLGLTGVWHRAVCGYTSRAVVPYAQRLWRFPAFLQQLEMESNGKGVDSEGRALKRAVGAVVWGAAGTDAQHSFFQFLHQGQQTVPVEFLVAARADEREAGADMQRHHRLLVGNCLAQSEALALGRTQAEAAAQLQRQGLSAEDVRKLAPHKTFVGNRPSISIVFDRLEPFVLGQLIALYEHRVFVEAAVHGINPFDQWGVELGKELAVALEPMVAGTASEEASNGSTRGLLTAIRKAGSA